MSIDLQDVKAFAAEQLEQAKTFATKIRFVEKQIKRSMALNESQRLRASASVGDDPEFASLDYGDGIAAWTTIAAVDLRGSTQLADDLEPRNVYLLTHTLLPTLAYVCENLGGTVMNFRGDGLFASFGLVKHRPTDANHEPEHAKILSANQQSVICGLALVEAARNAVQPVLSDGGIEVELSVGVGIDCGHVVVTRVGWMTAGELTAYGSPVNHACHMAYGKNQVLVTTRVQQAYPSSPTGTLSMIDMEDGYRAFTPSQMLTK